MEGKLISVIIPCFNVENYIDRCLNSLEKQTLGFKRLEVILVDDASTDGTWAKIEDFEKKHPENVMAIHCDENGRQGRARNIGMEYATCQYITFVDSDDWIEEDMLKVLYNPMKDRDYDFSMCMHIRDNGYDSSKYMYTNQKNGENVEGYKSFLIDSMEKRKIFILCMSIGSSCCGKIYKNSFLKENDIFFLEGLAYEDHLFMMLLYLYGTSFCMTDYVGYHYYVNLDSTVLKSNGSHHEDVICADELTLAETQKRGFYKAYREELDYYFMQIGFLGPLRNLLPRFDTPPYDFYVRLRERLLNQVPDLLANRYIDEYMTDMNKELLKIAAIPLSEANFTELFSYLKKGCLYDN